jgi:hypothetical protein
LAAGSAIRISAVAQVAWVHRGRSFSVGRCHCANAVVFAALNGLLLRPLNVSNPQSLYQLDRPGNGESYPNYLDLRERNHSFEALDAFSFSQDGLDTGDGAARAWGFETSGNYFDVLGVQPYLGRVFHASASTAQIALRT